MSYCILILLCIFTNRALAFEINRAQCKAVFEVLSATPQNKTTVYCRYIGVDGRSLDEVIRNITYVFSKVRERDGWSYNVTFAEIASSIKVIYAHETQNVTITENGLKGLTNLDDFEIEPRLGYVTQYDPFYLKIDSVREFKNTPKLRRLSIKGFALTDDSIEALRSLSDQVNILTLTYLSPGSKLLQTAQHFTNLTQIFFEGICENSPLPENVFKKSASKLEVIAISNCSSAKITKDIFSGMRSLWGLWWNQSNVTSIEAGAFDETPNLKVLHLRDNPIKNLPDGLFNKTKKLEKVDFSGPIENLSRDNFTHCANFKILVME